MMVRTGLKSGIKLIGIFLFVWIVMSVDRRQLWLYISQADPGTLVSSFVILLLIYAIKAERFRNVVRTTGVYLTFYSTWRLLLIGMAFSLLAPAGDLGRSAYLKKDGMHLGTAIGVAIVDRIADAIVVLLLAMIAVPMLFGTQWIAMELLAAMIGCCVVLSWWRLTKHTNARRTWLAFLETINTPRSLFMLLGTTLVAWILHFAWAVMIAQSLGMHISLTILLPALSIASAINTLPIAPSGLGTRDAVLLLLLSPYGIPGEQAISLAFLMFGSVLVTGILGVFYWLRGVPISKKVGIPV